MRLPSILSLPLMWRRHVKAQERIATALEDLLIIQMRVHGIAARPSMAAAEDFEDPEITLSVADDRTSWEAEQDDKRHHQG